jgi:hypothetical protein
MKRSLALIFAALTLVGCKEVQIQNGQIPAEYLAKAAEFMGSYEGEFQQKKAVITLTLDNDVVRVGYQDASGTDILAPQCESVIGLLDTINVSGSKADPHLDSAHFFFDPNKCSDQVIGRLLHLEFTKKNSGIKMVAEIIHHREWETRCGNSGPYSSGCETHPVNVYIMGEFKKLN